MAWPQRVEAGAMGTIMGRGVVRESTRNVSPMPLSMTAAARRRRLVA